MGAPLPTRPVEEPGLMQVMRRCPSCERRVRLRIVLETLAGLHRAIAHGVMSPDLPFLSYQCKCNSTFLLTLRELGFA